MLTTLTHETLFMCGNFEISFSSHEACGRPLFPVRTPFMNKYDAMVLPQVWSYCIKFLGCIQESRKSVESKVTAWKRSRSHNGNLAVTDCDSLIVAKFSRNIPPNILQAIERNLSWFFSYIKFNVTINTKWFYL